VEVEAQTGKKQYIVIVEPEKTHCIFTRVSWQFLMMRASPKDDEKYCHKGTKTQR
jgi:hypothetical protein